MVPFDALVPRPAGDTVAVRETTYPREVMEAGWVPEVVGLENLREVGRTGKRPGRQPAASEVLRSGRF